MMKDDIGATEESRDSALFLRNGLWLLTVVFSIVLGITLYSRNEAMESQLQPINFDADWICAPQSDAGYGQSAYFRKTIQIPGNVSNAWIAIAACDAYEVSVNRNPLGRFYLWRPTRPFHNGLSEKGQRLTSERSALALNFPREYQWDGHDSYRVPQVISLTNSFHAGKNVICIELESRGAPAKACFRGEIQLASGETIAFQSDETWRSEPVPKGPQLYDWTEPAYRDMDWRMAEITEGPAGQMFQSLDPAIYTTPFQGKWLRHPTATASDSVWFERSWDVVGKPRNAWLRIVANRQYALFINDERVGVPATRGSDLDSGDWIFGRQMAMDPVAAPELLDPDEIGSIYSGKRFESPRHADPRLENFTPLERIQRGNEGKRRATNQNDMPGTYDPRRSLAQSRRTPSKPSATTDIVTPKALSRDRIQGGYLAYNVTRLLKPGKNRVAIRMCSPASATAMNWTPQIAMDGSYFDQQESRVSGVSTWLDTVDEKLDAVAAGRALKAGQALPPLEYRGIANPSSSRWNWPWYAVICGLVSFALLHFARTRFDIATQDFRRVAFALLLLPTIAMAMTLLTRCCFAERHEMLVFLQPKTWTRVLLFAATLAAGVGFFEWLGRRRRNRADLLGLRQRGHSIVSTLRHLPETQLWNFAVIWVLILCGFLRAYKLDHQPLDDDEYASTQAVISIVETGVPGFEADGVYYTRSPLFHYVTAGVAKIFGVDLWSLRMQSVAWSVATAWLMYLIGTRLLRNRMVGLIAMLLFSIHPFQIFTGHVVRFYQMQQFFALLTVYLFCIGFVEEQSQKFRYLTCVSFLAAVVSQEISVVMAMPLAIGFLLFAKDLGWKANVRLAIVSALAMSVIVLDYAVFQTRCLTRVEGVSPNLEAAVKPHFWQPYNFLSLYIGYSRLHVMLSVFLLAGLPLVVRERNRNTISLHIVLVGGVIFTNILVTAVSLRYQFWLIPIWILLSVESIRVLVDWICSWAYNRSEATNRHMLSHAIASALIIVATIVSWSPWRIPGSYDIKILGDSTGAMQFVRSQLRTGDKIAATEPHAHCGFIEAGQIDYDISVPLLYDFAVVQDGKLIDRNGGAELVGSLDQLMQACHTHDRIWILLNREKFRTRGKNLRWEYPGARLESFIRKNCELKHRTYLWYVYLWDASRGFYVPYRQHDGTSSI